MTSRRLSRLLFGLTTKGLAATLTAATLLASGRMLGIFELSAMGAALVAVALVSALSVWLRGGSGLMIERTLDARSVHVGDVCKVTLSVRNGRARSSPTVLVRDHVDDGARRVATRVAPIPGNEARAAGYRLPVDVRGRAMLGPLELIRADPLGLFERLVATAPDAELLVHPRYVTFDLGSLRRASSANVHPWRAAPSTDGDLATIRAYSPGDDLRRVHWPLSARSGSLMVRELEHRGGQALAVLLDCRDSVHTLESFELAVSIAASFVQASAARHLPVTLGTNTGSVIAGQRLAMAALVDIELGGDGPSAVSPRNDARGVERQRRGQPAPQWPELPATTSDIVIITGPQVDSRTDVLGGSFADRPDRVDVLVAGPQIASRDRAVQPRGLRPTAPSTPTTPTTPTAPIAPTVGADSATSLTTGAAVTELHDLGAAWARLSERRER